MRSIPDALNFELPMGTRAVELFSEFERLGHRCDDFSAIIRLLRGVKTGETSWHDL